MIDSEKQINVDRQPPRAALLSARPSVIAPGEPGQQPGGAPALQRPVQRGARVPGLPHRATARPGWCCASAAAATARPSGTGGCARGGSRRRATTPSRSRCATARATRPRPRRRLPSARTARAGTGVSVRPFTLAGPLDVIPAGAVARLRVGPFDRSFGFVLSRLGSPRPVVRGRADRRVVPGAGAAPDAHGRLPRAGAGRKPARRLAARRGRAAADAGIGGPPAAARGAPGAHVAGPQPRGRRPRRLPGLAARRAARAARARVRGRRPPRRASARRARRSCASSTGRGSTTT